MYAITIPGGITWILIIFRPNPSGRLLLSRSSGTTKTGSSTQPSNQKIPKSGVSIRFWFFNQLPGIEVQGPFSVAHP